MNSKELKSAIGKFGYRNLVLNDGTDAPYFDKIKAAFDIADPASIIAFIDVDFAKKGERGVAVTESGLKWRGIAQTPDSDTEDLKSLWKSDELPFKRLGSFVLETERAENHFCVRLENRDIRDGEHLHIKMTFLYNAAEKESAVQADFTAFRELFSFLIAAEPFTETIPDDCDSELINAFIGGTRDSCEYYHEYFSRYAEKGGGFSFIISPAGFLFGAINLIHRKLYLAAVLWLFLCGVLACIFGSRSGILQILLSLGAAFVNPYLVYRRFCKILLDCHNNNLTHEQIIENLKMRGGANPITNAIYTSPIFTVVKVLIFIGIALEAISWVISLFR